MNPAKPLWVLPITEPADPCLNTLDPGCSRAVATYVRERSPSALAALPRLEGVTTTLWKLNPLTAQERTVVLSEPTDARKRAMAFSLAIHSRMDNCTVGPDGNPQGGVEVKAQVEKIGNVLVAHDSWLDEAMAVAGGQVITELGQLVIDRANVHPRALSPFRLPWGSSPAA